MQTSDIWNSVTDYLRRGNKKTAYNSGLAKVAVQCSADTFVVNQTLVIRINICGKSRHLRQAAKRYKQTLPQNKQHVK